MIFTQYIYDEDILNNIINVINIKKKEILNEINKHYYDNEMNYRGIKWGIKSVLSSKNEDNFNQRYADIEFSYIKVTIFLLGLIILLMD